jgi:hypothetical protein
VKPRPLGTERLERLIREQTRRSRATTFSVSRLEEQLVHFSDAIRLQEDLALIKILWSGPNFPLWPQGRDD